MTRKMFLALLLLHIGSLQLFAVFPEAPNPAVIKNRPVYPSPSGPGMPDVAMHKKMANIDNQIDELLTTREQLRSEADDASNRANAIMQQYQQEVSKQHTLEAQVKNIDSQVAGLVKQKTQLAQQIKK